MNFWQVEESKGNQSEDDEGSSSDDNDANEMEESKGSGNYPPQNRSLDMHYAAAIKETLVIHRKSALDQSLQFILDNLSSPKQHSQLNLCALH